MISTYFIYMYNDHMNMVVYLYVIVHTHGPTKSFHVAIVGRSRGMSCAVGMTTRGYIHTCQVFPTSFSDEINKRGLEQAIYISRRYWLNCCMYGKAKFSYIVLNLEAFFRLITKFSSGAVD